MATLIRTDTNTQNISAEYLMATYANDTGAGRDVAPQVRVSGLVASASTLRVRVAHLAANDAVLAPARVNVYWSKLSPTDTVWSHQNALSPTHLNAGEKLALYVTSNMADTAATVVVDWLDVSAPSVAAIAAGIDKTGYSLTEAYDAAMSAAQAGDEMALTSGTIADIREDIAMVGDEMTLTSETIADVQDGLAKTSELPDLTDTEAALAKIQAAIYDEFSVDGAWAVLSNGTRVKVTATDGREFDAS